MIGADDPPASAASGRNLNRSASENPVRQAHRWVEEQEAELLQLWDEFQR